MAEHNILGTKGEDLAKEFLIKNGYEILATNWHFRKVEVDIIATDGKEMVVVEVKTRTSNKFGEPEEFLSKQQQRNLVQAANAYSEISHNPLDIRFDIVSIIYNNAEHRIYHIKDAFSAVGL